MTKRATWVSGVMLFLALVAPVADVAAAPATGCKALKTKYPFGVAVNFSARGSSKAFISQRIYLKFQSLDQDFDGLICEIELLQQPKSVATSSTTTTTVPSCANGGPCKIGDIGPGGGVIFFDSNARNFWGRYLEAAPVTAWWNAKDPLGTFGCAGQWVNDGEHPIANNTFEQIGTGKANTEAILKSCKDTNSGAFIASSLISGGKNDWFLPSRNEQIAMNSNKQVIPGLIAGAYYSSTEADAERAYIFNFLDGLGYLSWKYSAFFIRPIRYVQCSIGCK